MSFALQDGVYGVTLSCFDDRGKFDAGLFEQELEYCCKTKINGIVLCGSTSEFVYLSQQDYRDTLSIAANVNRGRKSMIAGISGCTENAVLQNMADAFELGYEYQILCPPYYYPQSDEAVLTFYQYILSHMPTGVKLILYNIPFCTAEISLFILPQLLNSDKIAGFKDSSGNMLYFVKLLEMIRQQNPSIKLFTGQDMTLLPCTSSGGNGCMSTASWILDGLVTSVFQNAAGGDIAAARLQHRHLTDVLMRLDQIPFPENYRALALACGIHCGIPQRKYPFLQRPEFQQWLGEVKAAIESGQIQ